MLAPWTLLSGNDITVFKTNVSRAPARQWSVSSTSYYKKVGQILSVSILRHMLWLAHTALDWSIQWFSRPFCPTNIDQNKLMTLLVLTKALNTNHNQSLCYDGAEWWITGIVRLSPDINQHMTYHKHASCSDICNVILYGISNRILHEIIL